MLCTTQSPRNRKLPESPVVRMVFKSLETFQLSDLSECKVEWLEILLGPSHLNSSV